MNPTMRVVEMKQRQILCGSHAQYTTTNLDADTFAPEIIGGNGEGR